MFRTALIAFTSSLLMVSAAGADTLARIKDTGTLTIGHRTDAPPLSYKDAVGEPAGYSVALCRAIGAQIKEQLGLSELSLEYVPVTSEDRFQAVADDRIDILCGATTQTLSRREIVDFTLPTFVDGASVLLTRSGPQNFSELDGKKVAVRAGTTTEEALGNTLKNLSMNVETIAVNDHNDGLAKLLNDEVSAYFADRAILFFLLAGSGAQDKLFLADQSFTYEPHALALKKGDNAFRLAVDRALSRIYRTGMIANIFTAELGTNARPTPELQTLYRISTLPE